MESAPGRKSRVITWDRHEMRRQLKVFHIQSTFCMLHIGRWPFAMSQTIMDVRQLLEMCFVMLVSATACVVCVIFSNVFPTFLSPFWEHCILLRLPDRWHTAPYAQAQKLRPVWKVFAITCRPGPKLTRSEIFVSVYLPKRVVPVWVDFLYRSRVIRQKDFYGDRSELVPVSHHSCNHPLTWTTNLYGFLPCKSLEVTYGSVKIIFETEINCFAFSEPKKHHFVCKTTKNEQQLLRQNYFRPRHHQAVVMASTKIQTISERFPSASEDSFKTTFCSFSHVSKHFWTKWVTNSFSSANFALIS